MPNPSENFTPEQTPESGVSALIRADIDDRFEEALSIAPPEPEEGEPERRYFWKISSLESIEAEHIMVMDEETHVVTRLSRPTLESSGYLGKDYDRASITLEVESPSFLTARLVSGSIFRGLSVSLVLRGPSNELLVERESVVGRKSAIYSPTHDEKFIRELQGILGRSRIVAFSQPHLGEQ